MASLFMNMRHICALDALRAEARAVVSGCLRKTLKNKKGKKEGKEGRKREPEP